MASVLSSTAAARDEVRLVEKDVQHLYFSDDEDAKDNQRIRSPVLSADSDADEETNTSGYQYDTVSRVSKWVEECQKKKICDLGKEKEMVKAIPPMKPQVPVSAPAPKRAGPKKSPVAKKTSNPKVSASSPTPGAPVGLSVGGDRAEVLAEFCVTRYADAETWIRQFVASFASTISDSEIHKLTEAFGDMFLNDSTALCLANSDNHVGFCCMLELGWVPNKEFVKNYYHCVIDGIEGSSNIEKHFKRRFRMLSIMSTHAMKWYRTTDTTPKPTHYEQIDKVEQTPEALRSLISIRRDQITADDMDLLLKKFKHLIDKDESAIVFALVNNNDALNTLVLHGWYPTKAFVRSYLFALYSRALELRASPDDTALVNFLRLSKPTYTELFKFL